jgi:hypothetical protein
MYRLELNGSRLGAVDTLVKMVINLCFPEKAAHFLTS